MDKIDFTRWNWLESASLSVLRAAQARSERRGFRRSTSAMPWGVLVRLGSNCMTESRELKDPYGYWHEFQEHDI